MTSGASKYIRTREMAALLDASTQTIRRLCANGTIPAETLTGENGSHYRVLRADFEAYRARIREAQKAERESA